jgi:hypothetical protein
MPDPWVIWLPFVVDPQVADHIKCDSLLKPNHETENMGKFFKVSGSTLSKQRTPRVPDVLKSEISSKAAKLVEQHLKPAHVEQPENPQCNYIADIYTRWHREGLYFCATYVSPFPDAVSPNFEVRFARMGYLGNGNFSLAYKGLTGRWCEMYPSLSVDECLENVRDEPHFIP